jgi:hypothetical protein
LAIPSVGRYGRNALHTDAIEAQIVAGRWAAPKAGDTLTLPDGSVRAWEKVAADKEGWFSGRAFSGGYAFFSLAFGRQERSQTLLLFVR